MRGLHGMPPAEGSPIWPRRVTGDGCQGILDRMLMNESEQLALHWTKAQPIVAAYISSLVPDFHQAEEILHQVAVVLVRKFDQYDPDRPFVAWAIGMAKYEVLKHRRRVATDKHVFADDLLEKVGQTYGEMAGQLDDRREALALCLGEVRGRARQALELRYVDDLKPAAMASRLGMTAGAVRVLLHRVRAGLRDCIGRRLGEAAG